MAVKKPILLTTLDTETYNGLLGDLKKIAIYYGEEVVYGDSFLDIEPTLKKLAKTHRVHVYVHNLEFDSRKIPQLFENNRVIWGSSMCIAGKIATLKLKYCTIHDSFKILPEALKKLSENFDVEHGKLDLLEEVKKTYPGQYDDKDVVDFLDRCPVNDPLFMKYLGYDVLSLYEILEKIMQISGLELDEFVKIISTSSLSRYIFKNGYKGRKFMCEGRDAYKILTTYNWYDNLEHEEILRNAYCGGRTEVFTPFLNSSGFHYDVNSLYPFEMIDKKYPIGKPREFDNPDIIEKKWLEWLENHTGGGVIQCIVDIPVQDIPPLPCKMGKLVFPCGKVHGTWTFLELEYAVLNCGVKILSYEIMLFFYEMKPIFKDFISSMVEVKYQGEREKNKSLRSFGKLIMNCGYGYTGMRRDDKTSFCDIAELEKHENDLVLINKRLGYIEIETDVKAAYIQVQVAAYVTSYARLELLMALRYAAEKGTVFYCDTDSVVTDVPFSSDMVDEIELGKWKLEEEPERGIFLKPKVYVEKIGEKENIKFKGVSKATQADLTMKDYEDLSCYLQDENIKAVVVEKGKLMLPSLMVLQKNEKDLNYHEYRDKKFFLHNVEKRTIDYGKNTSEPLYFETLDKFENFDFKQGNRGVDLDLYTGDKLDN